MIHGNDRVEHITVEGMVQGVGFRPFVYSIAEKFSLGGYVTNTPDGVVIEIEGSSQAVDSFVFELEHNPPPLSRIVAVSRTLRPSSGTTSKRLYERFDILESKRDGKPVTLIPPDVCTCDDCLAELFDEQNRRYLYPFINCTNCGPRFTIIKNIPYDRPYTTMAEFTQCPACESEYNDPVNRRFHAQPNACPVCGPKVDLFDSSGKSLPGDPIATAIELLKEGRIVAIKGLGGFHFAVDGCNDDAVRRLRSLKNREEKPLASMVGSITAAQKLVILETYEERILMSRERPILLAARHGSDALQSTVAESVAPGNPHLGIMLPYTPLHYLLFYHPSAGGDFSNDQPVFTALVMTSGNMSEEPVCKDNDEAFAHLGHVADYFLVHDRDIHVRCDDSVVRCLADDVQYIRRSRGFVPSPVFLPEQSSSVLAFGGELKNTLCITEGRRAFMSQHVGDLENIPTLEFFHEAVTHFKRILDIEPSVFAYDLHPDYLSTKYAVSLFDSFDDERYSAVGVQHHHAHIASVMAEHGQNGPVIGFSMDGTGYGSDTTVWGGEVLLCTPYSFTRAVHLDYIPMPGGTSAVREPWRMAFSYLRETFGSDWRSLELPCLSLASPENFELLDRACAAGLNAPRTSSLGRLFDAAASILDICHKTSYEGQASIMLELCAAEETSSRVLPYTIRHNEEEPLTGKPVLHGAVRGEKLPEAPRIGESAVIDYRPLVRALAEGKMAGESISELALSFHTTILASFLETAEFIRESTGITTTALSGGCWQNRFLSIRFQSMLEERGFNVLIHNQVPPNDGGLALGQAFVASCIVNMTEKRKSYVPCCANESY
ncbi:carbamoyltransferase HypF [Candidatus Omnitrophota bacterium]